MKRSNEIEELSLRLGANDICLMIAVVKDWCLSVLRKYRRVILICPWFDLDDVSARGERAELVVVVSPEYRQRPSLLVAEDTVRCCNRLGIYRCL